MIQEIMMKIASMNEFQLMELNEAIDKILKPRKHRTLSQNAYLWKLVNEIGNKVGKSKEEIYFEMLVSYGQCELISMLSHIDPNGYLKYYSYYGKGEVNGKQFNHYKIYKGSSEYNTLEMKILLDYLIMHLLHMINY